jgi:hypothetical protein
MCEPDDLYGCGESNPPLVNVPNYYSTMQYGWNIPGRGFLNTHVQGEPICNTYPHLGELGVGTSITTPRCYAPPYAWPTFTASGFEKVE